MEFFNSIKSPYEIRDRIKDDPNFGSSFRYGVTLSTAKRILKERNKTADGRFTTIEQIDAVQGVGPSAFHNILYTFQIDSLEDSKLIFTVSIEGIAQENFLEIEGLESTTKIVAYDDGYDPIKRKRPGRTSFSNIILRRGYFDNAELWNWRRKVIGGFIERKSGSIVISDKYNNEIARYNFFEAWPCRWETNLLCNTNGHSMPTEEIELVVEKLERG
ncbi:MAG: hypothetical protein GY702_00600 [Desulfobulbaceae bacterium]|nr:hypothetical protein [Desulfobulbaceae bacterium]